MRVRAPQEEASDGVALPLWPSSSWASCVLRPHLPHPRHAFLSVVVVLALSSRHGAAPIKEGERHIHMAGHALERPRLFASSCPQPARPVALKTSCVGFKAREGRCVFPQPACWLYTTTVTRQACSTCKPPVVSLPTTGLGYVYMMARCTEQRRRGGHARRAHRRHGILFIGMFGDL